MGFRYRKSINLGGGFRVNFSKSGIGYSWGTKGYRVTKKAGGGTRRTYSIPGSGLSWTEDSGGRKKTSGRKSVSRPIEQNTGAILYQAENADVKQLVTENTQEFLAAIKKYSGIRTVLILTCIFSLLLSVLTPLLLLLFVAGIAGLIYLSASKKVSVEYDCDEYGNRRIQMMNEAMNFLSNNKVVWQVNTIQANSSRKTHAGAAHSVGRKAVKFLKKKPYFLKTDATCYYIKLTEDQLYILPDRLIVKGKKGWGAVDYSELRINTGNVIFIEDGATPRDATIVGHTWQYVNKDGSRDKRFKNNRQLPRCNYGNINFVSNTGLNIMIYVSNIENAKQFATTVQTMIREAEQTRLLANTESMSKETSDSDDYSYNKVEDESQQNEEAVLHTYNDNVYAATEKNVDDLIPDVNEEEQKLLGFLRDKLDENNLSRKNCSIKKLNDGTIEILYKGASIGKANLTSPNAWLEYPMGNTGKIKRLNGTGEELIEKTSNWIRYMVNYM